MNPSQFPLHKYKRPGFAPPKSGFKRTWPDREIINAPIWCSVDLRDGNQALINPMDARRKLGMFKVLRDIGFREIETGFPAASDTEFKIHRRMIEKGLIGGEIVPQVLCQARKELIQRTFAAMEGCEEFIFHIYNSTSEAQRRIVFGKTQREIIDVALEGVKLVKDFARNFRGKVRLQYSPESFTGTKMPFAFEICQEVFNLWNPRKGEKVIINLPATVEHTTSNIYADQIEWMIQQFTKAGMREQAIISLHTHNDRGTSVAATEMGLLAGADRVEGTLFGNGERTGNVDLMNLALNMASHGVDPKLCFDNLPRIVRAYERYTELTVPARHPYAGELAYTAFSGSHQDAIKKGMADFGRRGSIWEVPYLAIDPKDIGREYKEVVRVNNQSGKSGAVAILDRDFGLKFPIKGMQQDVGKCSKQLTERVKREITAQELLKEVMAMMSNSETPLSVKEFRTIAKETQSRRTIVIDNQLTGKRSKITVDDSQGPIHALLMAVKEATGVNIDVVSFEEDKLNGTKRGSAAKAAAYVGVKVVGAADVVYGLGISTDSAKAVRDAVMGACNQILVNNKKKTRTRLLSNS